MKRSVSVLLVALVAGFLNQAAPADSLFSKRTAESGTLISLQKAAFKPGDILTVLVRETVEASTESGTRTKKESDVQSQAGAGANEFLVSDDGLNLIKPEELPNWQIEAENEHKTKGETTRSNKLVLTITCQVMEQLPNGNLRIQGTKRVTVNSEDTTIVLNGTVRPRDISPNNTIASNLIADASIELQGKGPLWNNQRRGFLTKFLDWFSPF